MSVGIPGAGIGGVFYLLSAVWMPVHELRRTRPAGEPRPWALIGRQLVIAGGIVGGIWVMGWLIGIAVAAGGGGAVRVSASGVAVGHAPAASVIRAAALAGTLGILGLVLAAVQVLRIAVRLRRLPRISADAA